MNNKGSITLEATFIMLTCLWVVFLIIMAAFYCWDMNRLYITAQRLVDEEAGKITKTEEILDAASLKESFLKELETGFFFIDTDCTVVVEDEEVCIAYSGVWKCPIQGWIFLNNGFEYQDKATAEKHHPEKILKVVQGAIKGLGG